MTEQQSPITTTITSPAQFDELVRNNKYVIIDFHATWCGPCKAIAPLFTQHATAHSEQNTVAFAKVDIDAVPEVAQRFAITTIPSFVLLRDGKTIDDVRSANAPKLNAAVESVAAEVARMKDGGKPEENVLAKDIENEDW